MRATDSPRLSLDWWEQERPQELESTELDKVLPRVERALREEQRRSSDARAIDRCLAILKKVPAAADRTIRECDRRRHKDVISVLKKYHVLVKTEMQRLREEKQEREKAARGKGKQEEKEEEAGDDKLFEKAHLYKMMKLIKSARKELNFAFGLNTSTPESSQLLLHRKRKPEMLFKILKRTKQFPNRCLTYGFAKADPQEATTLVMRLEASANEPPRMLKLGRLFLRSDKKLRFRKLKLVVKGKVVEDTEPDESNAAA